MDLETIEKGIINNQRMVQDCLFFFMANKVMTRKDFIALAKKNNLSSKQDSKKVVCKGGKENG